MSIVISYGPACKKDCAEIYRWENDAGTRAMSDNVALFTYETHLDWFEKSLCNPNRQLYIARNGYVAIGLIRFDATVDENFEVSLILNPAYRGKGLSTQVLSGGVCAFLQKNNGVRKIFARVKTCNIASNKCFVTAGFKLICSSEQYYNYALEIL